MRICHVITRLIIGGAQENTILTCEGLHARGHDVVLFAGPETGAEGSLWPRAQAGGYAVEVVDTLRRSVAPWRDHRCCVALRRHFERLRPDVVHTHSSKAGIVGRVAARRAGVPAIVHTIHGMSFNRTQSSMVRTIYRSLECRCGAYTDAFISVADAMTDQAAAAGLGPREKFTTIHSGMETEQYDPARYDRHAVRAAWGVEPQHIVVGTVARLFRNKGYEQLIPAMEIAAAADERLRFVWVGDGADRPRYEARLRAANLAGRVHLTGLVPPDEVPRLLAGMDIVVHASQWEGLPRVLVQALLLEVPVISFDNDGAPEVVIPGQTGELVPFGDMAALGASMLSLSAQPALRDQYGREGRQRCLAQFDHHRMTEGIEATYRRAARK